MYVGVWEKRFLYVGFMLLPNFVWQLLEVNCFVLWQQSGAFYGLSIHTGRSIVILNVTDLSLCTWCEEDFEELTHKHDSALHLYLHLAGALDFV